MTICSVSYGAFAPELCKTWQPTDIKLTASRVMRAIEDSSVKFELFVASHF